jgi:hypothetical protein
MNGTVGLLPMMSSASYVSEDRSWFAEHPEARWHLRPLGDGESQELIAIGGLNAELLRMYLMSGREAQMMVVRMEEGRIRLPVSKEDGSKVRLGQEDPCEPHDLAAQILEQMGGLPRFDTTIMEACAECRKSYVHGDVTFAPSGAPVGILVCRKCYEKRPFAFNAMTIFMEHEYNQPGAKVSYGAKRNFNKGLAYIKEKQGGDVVTTRTIRPIISGAGRPS